MAEFTRKELKAIFEAAEIDVPKDVLGQICTLHTDSLDGLSETVKNLRTSLETAERERDTYKAKAPKDGEETVLKSDYDKLSKDFEDYKESQTAKETRQAKERAIRELYKAAGISEKRLDLVVKVTDIDAVELDKDGKIKDAEERTKTAKTEWADFIETTHERGANTATPPANGGKTAKTKAEIYKMENGRYVLSASERQAALKKLYETQKGE